MHVRGGDLDIWTEQVGQGPDVLLIGGLGDHAAVGAQRHVAMTVGGRG